MVAFNYYLISYSSDCDSWSSYPVGGPELMGLNKVEKRGNSLYQVVVEQFNSFHALTKARELILSYIYKERIEAERSKPIWKPRGTDYRECFWYDELGRVDL